MTRLEKSLAGIIIYALGLATVLIMAATIEHAERVAEEEFEERWCVSPTGHKRVRCP